LFDISIVVLPVPFGYNLQVRIEEDILTTKLSVILLQESFGESMKFSPLIIQDSSVDGPFWGKTKSILAGRTNENIILSVVKY
jgi:hypothetical protein